MLREFRDGSCVGTFANREEGDLSECLFGHTRPGFWQPIGIRSELVGNRECVLGVSSRSIHDFLPPAPSSLSSVSPRVWHQGGWELEVGT